MHKNIDNLHSRNYHCLYVVTLKVRLERITCADDLIDVTLPNPFEALKLGTANSPNEPESCGHRALSKGALFAFSFSEKSNYHH